MFRTFVAAAAIAFATASAAGAAERSVAHLKGPDGADHGTVVLKQAPQGVLIEIDVNGLPPGAHGFHIHQTGSCEPDFEAAGGHFNPGNAGHGIMSDQGHHAGDLPNIYVDGEGKARVDVFWTEVSLTDGDTTLFDGDGSAIVVHENPDSYGADAGAGGRIACGVIQAD